MSNSKNSTEPNECIAIRNTVQVNTLAAAAAVVVAAATAATYRTLKIEHKSSLLNIQCVGFPLQHFIHVQHEPTAMCNI